MLRAQERPVRPVARSWLCALNAGWRFNLEEVPMQSGLPIFTLVHVVLSIVGIIAGLVVVGGFMAGVRFDRWTAVFLGTTLLTSATGFGFPFTQLLPAHMVGALSLLVLPFAFVAFYGRHLEGRWREVFVSVSVLALYLNVFVLLAQLLQKIPVLAALAPTPSAPAFAVTQLLFLAIFAGVGWASINGFRIEQRATAMPLGAAVRPLH
jgi:hypothetical protein